MQYIEDGLEAAANVADAAEVAGVAIPKSLVDAKGDLLVGSAADTIGRLAVGSNDQVLTADSTQSVGVKWSTPTLVPSGSIVQYGGASAPTGWLLCDGTAVSRTTYSALFTAISTSYGTGDGSTTFNLPDFQGRVPVGKGSHTDVDALGDNDGAALASRRVKHKHTVNDSGHTHTAPWLSNGAQAGGGSGAGGSGTGPSGGSATTGVTVGPQTSVPTDGPAFLVVNYIIKT